MLLEGLRAAHARARSRAWELGVRPERVTIELDATLITSHSDKDGAAGNFKGGFGFHPMLAYLDETSEAMAGILRPGNAGANNVADQIGACDLALAQVPAEHIEDIEILLRADSAGATHELINWCREADIRFSPEGRAIRLVPRRRHPHTRDGHPVQLRSSRAPTRLRLLQQRTHHL